MAGDAANLALNMEVRLYAMRNPDIAARVAEHQRGIRRALAQFIVETAERIGGTLTVAPMTLAGILEAASWGISESTAVDPEDGDLLEAFFELFVDAACVEESSPSNVVPQATTS